MERNGVIKSSVPYADVVCFRNLIVSLTCREYESQMADYERQRKYRLQYG